MMHIDKKSFKIKQENHYNSESIKSQIIIGTSLRKDNNHITRLQHKDYGKTKKWNTFTISRNGIVYQHYDDMFFSDFLGNKETDKHSISIVLENMGGLMKIQPNTYVNWLNEVCEENVIKKEYLSFDYWETFPDIQLTSLLMLCKHLCTKHNIPLKFIGFSHYHKEIHKFKGITFRGNHIENSSDMVPLFDISIFNKTISNEII